MVVIPAIKPSVEAKLGQRLGLSTLYGMLKRHGWRKLALDTRHPKSDPAAQEAFKKTFPNGWHKP